MASNPPGACCFKGFKHEGVPSGELVSIDGVPTYVAKPAESDTSQAGKAILIISDVFGVYDNAKFIADDFASNGYLTLLPDILEGDALPLDIFSKPDFNIMAWGANHGPPNIDPIVEKMISHLRNELKIKSIGGVGYCFGGKYVVRFLKNGKMDAGYSAHPSFVTREELAAIEKPFSIAASEIDSIFTTALRHESEEILIKTKQPFQINLFSGVEHGFAVRGDLSQDMVKYGKEQAFLQAVNWFQKWL